MRLSRTARMIAGQINKQFGKTAKIKEEPFIMSPFRNLNASEKLAIKVQPKFIFAQMDAMPKMIHGMGDIVFTGEKFGSKKEKLIQAALSFGDKCLAQRIAKSKNGEDLYQLCYKYCVNIAKSMQKSGQEMITKTNGKFTLDLEQAIEQMRTDRFNKITALYKAIETKSANPKVVEIENILKKEFGMKYVNLEDDLPRAEQILRVVRGLQAKGYPIPNNVIISDLHLAAGEMCIINGERTMLLQTSRFAEATEAAGNNPDILRYILKVMSPSEFDEIQRPLYEAYSKGIPHFSTTMEDHIATHECLHGNHSMLMAFFNRALPSRFKPTVKNISLYVNMNTNNAEILTELESKLHLTGNLTPEEMELYKYIKQFQLYA